MASLKKTSSRWILWLLLIVLLLIGGWYYFKKDAGNADATYLTAPVAKGDVTLAVTATGTLNPVLNVQVGSQISGIIQKLNADFNTIVKEGQIIAQIDPGTYSATVAVSQGDLANAQAALELATVNAARTKRLLTSNTAAQSEVDAAVATLHQAQAQIIIKQGALDRAKIDFERCTIYAPIDGIVISRSVDVGQTVAASLSAPVLFTIANDLAKMQIDANVAEADVGAVEVGQKVNFTVDAFPYRTFVGTIIQVRNAPITVQNVVTYDTVISVDNADLKLKPGMTANVSILIAERQGVLKIPNSALRIRLDTAPPAAAPAVAKTGGEGRTRGGPGGGGGKREGGGREGGGKRGKQNVYILPAGAKKPESREVELGISDGTATEVISGLNEGDLAVTSVLQSKSTAAAGPPPPNPFTGGGGGGQRRGF